MGGSIIESSILISLICIMILLTMIGMVNCNAIISPTQRTGFMRTMMIVIVVIILEIVSFKLDGAALKFKALHSLVNHLGFILSPVVFLSIINLIAPRKYVKVYNLIYFIYALISTVGLPVDLIFGITDKNYYFRSYGYPIFMVTYLLYIIVLMFETLRMYEDYQKSDKLTLIPLMLLTIAGSSVQIINPNIHTTWLAVTFLVILYYTHCANLWHQIDGLTGLLTQKVYLHDLGKVRLNSGVYIFDLDDFKSLNDSLGHSTGDKALSVIASLILDVYGKHGTCYRIGGDEMSVILHRKIDEIHLSNTFQQRLSELRTVETYLPTVSIGCAILTEGKDVSEVIDQADKLMYTMKRRNL